MTNDKWKTEVYSIQCPTLEGGDYDLLAIRQQVRTYENGDAHKIGSCDVRRKLSDIAFDAIPGGPFQVATVADLLPIFEAMGEHYHAQDLAAEEARRARDEEFLNNGTA